MKTCLTAPLESFSELEKDFNNFSSLQAILEALKLQYPNVGIVGPFNSDFASVVDKVIEQTDGRLIPSFFFIDPFGFTDVPFQTVKRILSLQRSEVFITWMVRDIGRFLSHPDLGTTFDLLFGIPEWRDIVASGVTNDVKEL